MEKKPGLGPELYDKNYYRHSLPGLEHSENPELIDEAAPEMVRIGKIKPGQHILDFGCGRGTCAMALARYGFTVVGIDFSQDAVDFAREYAKRFPDEIQKRVSFLRRSMNEVTFEQKFDCICLNQVYEHLHDWELEVLMQKFKRALKPDGVLIISTPNLNYERFLFPLKRIIELPFKTIKMLLRILRGRSKHTQSAQQFFGELFKIRYPESEHTRLHINLQTPASIKQFMQKQGFRVHVECVDSHANPITSLLRPWWGKTIWLSGTPYSIHRP